MNRFAGFQVDKGLAVLDQATGELIFYPQDGTLPHLWRPAIEAGPPNVSAGPVPVLREIQPAASGPSMELFDQEVCSTFPYPIAKTYLAFLTERDPRLRCKLLVDTFTNVLKVWALQTASENLRAPGCKDPVVNQTLARDFQRPLISTWNRLLETALPVLREAGVAPFSPELDAAYNLLERRCQSRVTIRTRYEDAEGNLRLKESKLGKIQALIKYRNSLAHGYNQSMERAGAELEQYQPILREILKAARFMARYPLYVLDSASGRDGSTTVDGYRLMGASPTRELEALPCVDFDPKASPLFLRNGATGETLPLFAFFEVEAQEEGDEAIPGLGKDLFLYEGNTATAVIYISSTGYSLEKKSRMGHWKTLLQGKDMEVKALNDASLSLDTLRAAARRISAATVDKLVESGKYLREASVGRPDLDERLSQFETGHFRGFVLGGDSGIGKSTLLARYAESADADDDVVVFYRASALQDTDLAARVVRDCGLRGMHFEDFLQALDGLFRHPEGEPGPTFRIIVDAVNEHPADVAGLIRAIDAMVAQAQHAPWFRLLVSIRTTVYERLPANARFACAENAHYLMVDELKGAEYARTPLINLRPLEASMLPERYERYRQFKRRDPDDPEAPGVFLFNPRTPFAELDPTGSTCIMMRNPLMMRLIMSAFNRRALPGRLSYEEAMKIYVDQVVVEVGNPGASFPERRNFLNQLIVQMDHRNSDAIPRDLLYQVPSLARALQNAQKDSPYVQLLDLGVLLEEWDQDVCLVRFSFDRLLEYLLANHHDERLASATQVLALCTRALAFKSLKGTLQVLLARACREGRLELIVETLDACDPQGGNSAPPEQAVALEVVRDLLEHLARSQDPVYGVLLELLPERPGETDVLLLLDLFDRLFRGGEGSAAEQAVRVALREAEALGDDRLQAAALLRLGHWLNQSGQPQAALDTLTLALGKAETIGEPLLCHRINHLRGKYLDDEGRHEEGFRILGLAFAGLMAQDALTEAARARTSQAQILNRRFHKPEEAARIAEEAYAIAVRAQQPEALRHALTCLGILAIGRGEVELAERLYAEALQTALAAGLLLDAARVHNRMGELFRMRAESERAEAEFQKAKVFAEKTGHRREAAEAILNLGKLRRQTGALDEAEALLSQALSIFEAITAAEYACDALRQLASLAHQRQLPEEEERWLTLALANREASPDRMGRYSATQELSRHWQARGEPGQALAYATQALAALETEVDPGCLTEARDRIAELKVAAGLRE